MIQAQNFWDKIELPPGRDSVKIPVKEEQPTNNRNDEKKNCTKAKIEVRRSEEKASDFFSKFDASVRDNAEKAKSTIEQLKLDGT